ncbi:MAG: ATP-dependent sacrificial sulfur transferase LarE [Desulfobacterales bacterium]
MSKIRKLKELEALLANHEPLAVAFSGGVDSSFLLAVACRVLPGAVTAVTVDSPLFPRREKNTAVAIARHLRIPHLVLRLSDERLLSIRQNLPDRCYVCKKMAFGDILKEIGKLGIPYLVHGANVDDANDYRPGLRAAEEMKVTAPLAEAGLTKAEIRNLSRTMGLSTWNKPSMACLASRIPYGTPLDADILRRVEAAEDVLIEMGFEGARVRYHGAVARVELRASDLARAVAPPIRLGLVKGILAAGFDHVALDLEGYVQGSLNRSIPT